jgi:hypothetical protein
VHFTHDCGWGSVVLTIALVLPLSDDDDVFVVVGVDVANESKVDAKWSEKL